MNLDLESARGSPVAGERDVDAWLFDDAKRRLVLLCVDQRKMPVR